MSPLVILCHLRKAVKVPMSPICSLGIWFVILIGLLAPRAHAENSNPYEGCRPPTWTLSIAGDDELCPTKTGIWNISFAPGEDGSWWTESDSGSIKATEIYDVKWRVTSDDSLLTGGGGTEARWTVPDDYSTHKRGPNHPHTVIFEGMVKFVPNDKADCRDTKFIKTKTFTVHPKKGKWSGPTEVTTPDDGSPIEISALFTNAGHCTEKFRTSHVRNTRVKSTVTPFTGSITLASGASKEYVMSFSQRDQRPLAARAPAGWIRHKAEIPAGYIFFWDYSTGETHRVDVIRIRWYWLPPNPIPGPTGGPFILDDPDSNFGGNNAGGGLYANVESFQADGRHRSVDLTGVPKSEQSPTGEEEMDRKPDDTYIDMLTLSPSYSVTDVSLPVEYGELSLDFRRSSGIRSMDATYDPLAGYASDRVAYANDLLLGRGWSCSLGARAMINYGGDGVYAATAAIIDELGEQLRYQVSFTQDDGGLPQLVFEPVSLGGWSHDAFKATLEVTRRSAPGNGSEPVELTLTKRFGTKVIYEYAGLYIPTQGGAHTSVFRIAKVIDRNNNGFHYQYEQRPVGNSVIVPIPPGTSPGAFETQLLPSRITSGQRFLAFEYNRVGPSVDGKDTGWRLTAVSDPGGRRTLYGYGSAPSPIDHPSTWTYPPVSDRPAVGPVLTSVTKIDDGFAESPGSSITRFAYHVLDILPNDQVLQVGQEFPKIVRFIAPSAITDARGHTTSLSYQVIDVPPPGGVGMPEPTLCLEGVQTADGAITVSNDERMGYFRPDGTFATELTVRTHVVDTTGVRTDYRFVQAIDPQRFAVQNLVKVERSVQDGAATAVVTFDYANDPAGNLIKVTDRNGSVIEYEYSTGDPDDAFDAPVDAFVFDSKTRPNLYQLHNLPAKRMVRSGSLGLVTTYRYDPVYRALVRTVDAEGVVTAYSLDSRGNRITSTEAVGTPAQRVSRFEYDTHGFMTLSIDGEGRRIESFRGFAGANVSESGPQDPYMTVFTRRILDDGIILQSTRQENLFGDVISEQDGLGNTTEHVYDRSRRLRTTLYPSVQAPIDGNAYLGAPPGNLRWALPSGVNGIGQDGRIRGRVDRFYDQNGNPVRTVDENGHVTVTTFDSRNRPISVRRRMVSAVADSPADLVTSMTYTPRGQVETTTDARGAMTRSVYDDCMRLTRRELPDGLFETHAYGINSGAGTWTLRSGWQPTRSVDVRGNATDTLIDGFYRPFFVVRRRDAATGQPTSAPPRPASGGLPADITVTAGYNRVHKPVRIARNDPGLLSGERVSLTWYDQLYQATATAIINDTGSSQVSAALRGGFHASGATAPAVAVEHRMVRTVYDRGGRVASTVDPQGRRTEMRYDVAGRLVKTLLPAVPDASLPGDPVRTPQSEVIYDWADRPEITIDARGLRTKQDFDGRSRVVRAISDLDGDGLFETNGHDIVVGTVYDLAGNVMQRIDTRGAVTDLRYDAAGRLVSQTAPEVADAEQAGAMTRPVTVTIPDKNGNIVEARDARGVTTVSTFDAFNRPLSVTAAAGTPSEVVTRSSYDAAGNVQSLTLENRVDGQLRPQVTTYAYDAFNRKLSETLPAVGDGITRQTVWTYTTSGEVASKTDPKSEVTSMTYDGFGQLIATTVQVGSVFAQQLWLSYTHSGKLETVIDTELRGAQAYTQVTSHRYDALDRLISESYAGQEATPGVDTMGPAPQVVESGYDLGGNRVRQRREPGRPDERVVTSTFDRVGRVRTIVDAGAAPGTGTSTYAYDATGNRLSLTRQGGLVDSYTYDALNRVQVATTVGAQGQVYRVAYAYDLVGNRRQATETLVQQGDQTTTYAYDAQYRLTGEAIPGRNVTYAYDPAGNRLRMDVDLAATATTAAETQRTMSIYDDLNRLLSNVETTMAGLGQPGVVTRTYTYDRNGNRSTLAETGHHHRTFRWDAIDRLIGVDETDGTGAVREIFVTRYDARTRRREVTESGTTTVFRYDGGDSYRETTPAGQTTVEFIRGSGMGGGIGSILTTDRRAANGPVESFVYNPAVGHTVATIASDGSAVSTNRYEAFGNIRSTTGSSKNNRLANTKERSAVLGLDNHGFRYYDPVIGRYISMDPLGYGAGTMNLYAYVGSNPINHVDPLGLIERDELRAQHEALAEQADEINDTIATGGDASGMYKQYMAGQNELVRNSSEFLGEQWITSGADIDAASLHQGLPITFDGMSTKAAQGEIADARQAQGEFGTQIEGTITNLERTETALQAVETTGTVIGAATGAGALAVIAKEATKFGLKEGLKYAAKESIKQVAKDQLGLTHGNSNKSRKVAEGYALVGRKTGQVLKYGETTRGPKRYSQKYLKSKDAIMEFRSRGTKANMKKWETKNIRDHTEKHGKRPPLNKTDH